jgi:hypothetical protein
MLTRLLVSVLVLTLTACATPVDPAKRAYAQETIPKCFSDRECELKWAAARKWVLDHSPFKMKTVTPDYLETYGPMPNDPSITMRVSKEPIKTGGYRIVVGVWCDNMFGCTPNAWDTAIRFNKDVTESTLE